MWVNDVRHARNPFHMIINKNGQDSLRYARSSFSREALGFEEKKKKRNFTALANDFQDKLGNSQATPKISAFLWSMYMAETWTWIYAWLATEFSEEKLSVARKSGTFVCFFDFLATAMCPAHLNTKPSFCFCSCVSSWSWFSFCVSLDWLVALLIWTVSVAGQIFTSGLACNRLSIPIGEVRHFWLGKDICSETNSEAVGSEA